MGNITIMFEWFTHPLFVYIKYLEQSLILITLIHFISAIAKVQQVPQGRYFLLICSKTKLKHRSFVIFTVLVFFVAFFFNKYIFQIVSLVHFSFCILQILENLISLK